MKCHQLRWALLCVAACPTVCTTTPAYADRTVVIGPGDNVDTLARRFHVSTRDIERANSITKETLLRDGRRLIIPDAPKQVVRPNTMRKTAVVAGDRVTFRLGPNEGYRRVSLLDAGKEVIVTGKAGDWYQSELPNGKIAWVRSDFITLGGTATAVSTHSTRVARNDDDEDSRSTRKAKRRRSNDDEDRPKARRSRRSRYARAISRRHRKYAHHSRPEANAPQASNEVIRTAYSYRGVPYHYGGSSGRGFDCSGFTSYVYGKKGVSLPHSASGQFGKGKKVTSEKLKQGDLVFFSTGRRRISHVGIYVGEGKFVHASSGGGRVRVDTLTSGYYKNRFRGARRVKDAKEPEATESE